MTKFTVSCMTVVFASMASAADAPSWTLIESVALQKETSGCWKKFEGNPVMGGKHGTCFDISGLKEGDIYRMWLSWRPEKSIALVESKDGIRWSEPPQAVFGPRLETAKQFRMWYSGGEQNEPNAIG